VITINDFAIDAALREEHSFESEVTQFPVEDGADITDHVRTLPKVVTIEGVVSDTPLGKAAVARAGVNALIEDGLIEPTTASADALAALTEIHEAREPVTITTSLRLYENMVMESLTIPRDAETGAALRFTATFRQIVIVANQRVRVRVAVPRGKGKRSLGHQASKPFDGPPTYWCLEDRSVYVKAGDASRAQATRDPSTPDVWTDFRAFPIFEYDFKVDICTRKEQVGYDSKANSGRGALVRRGADGKPVELSQQETDAMNNDLREKAGFDDAIDPAQLKDSKDVVFIDRPYVDDPQKPWWSGVATQALKGAK
jgi:hypothetical protein